MLLSRRHGEVGQISAHPIYLQSRKDAHLVTDAIHILSYFHAGSAFVFGYVNGCFTGVHPIRSALQTALIGGLAAAAAYGLAKLISK